MAALNGHEVNERMEGSTSVFTGETWSNGESVRVKSGRDNHGLVAKGGTSNNQANKDHLHFYDNPSKGEKHHKSDYAEGQRLVENKQMRKDKDPEYISEKLGNAVRNFMGW